MNSFTNEPSCCGFCTEQMSMIEPVPACRHTFHSECMAQWTGPTATCPYCVNTIPITPQVLGSARQLLDLEISSMEPIVEHMLRATSILDPELIGEGELPTDDEVKSMLIRVIKIQSTFQRLGKSFYNRISVKSLAVRAFHLQEQLVVVSGCLEDLKDPHLMMTKKLFMLDLQKNN